MAVFEHAPYASTDRSSIFAQISDMFATGVHAVRRHFIRIRTSEELAALSDHQLEDIGVVRADIAAISDALANKGYY